MAAYQHTNFAYQGTGLFAYQTSAEVAEPVHVGRVDDRARRAVDELLVLAQGQHDLLQRAAALRAELRDLEAAQQRAIEQDDEDALIWMF